MNNPKKDIPRTLKPLPENERTQQEGAIGIDNEGNIITPLTLIENQLQVGKYLSEIALALNDIATATEVIGRVLVKREGGNSLSPDEADSLLEELDGEDGEENETASWSGVWGIHPLDPGGK